MPPDGFQNYGSAVVNENAVPLYLHCIIGTSVPKNLNCSFLDPQKWSCFAGVCSPDPNGIYNSQAQCEAALIPPPFTGGQCAGIFYTVTAIDITPSGYSNPIFLTPNTPFTVNLSGTIGVPVQVATNTWGIPYNSGANTHNRSNPFGLIGIQIISVVRADGQPDNCGNLPSTCP